MDENKYRKAYKYVLSKCSQSRREKVINSIGIETVDDEVNLFLEEVIRVAESVNFDTHPASKIEE
jgi:hypothetical protein